MIKCRKILNSTSQHKRHDCSCQYLKSDLPDWFFSILTARIVTVFCTLWHIPISLTVLPGIILESNSSTATPNVNIRFVSLYLDIKIKEECKTRKVYLKTTPKKKVKRHLSTHTNWVILGFLAVLFPKMQGDT